MQKKVGLACLIKGTLERVYQVGRQFADESYGIGKEERQVVYHYLANGGVEGGKEFVLGKHLALAEQIHDGRFTYVGIAHQCHAHHSASVLSLCSLLLVDFCQSLFEETHSAEDDTAVHLKLGLTWSTQTN